MRFLIVGILAIILALVTGLSFIRYVYLRFRGKSDDDNRTDHGEWTGHGDWINMTAILGLLAFLVVAAVWMLNSHFKLSE